MKINDENVMAVCPETGRVCVSNGWGSRWVKASPEEIQEAILDGIPCYTEEQTEA